MKVKQNVPGQILPTVSMGMKSSLAVPNCSASLHFVRCAKASAIIFQWYSQLPFYLLITHCPCSLMHLTCQMRGVGQPHQNGKELCVLVSRSQSLHRIQPFLLHFSKFHKDLNSNFSQGGPNHRSREPPRVHEDEKYL